MAGKKRKPHLRDDGFLWGFRGTRSDRSTCEITPKATVADVRECVRRCGGHFFDRDTMRVFNSKVERTAYTDNEGGAFFVTSEVPHPYHEVFHHRYYTVRRYNANTCSITTVGGLYTYSKARDARAAAKAASKASQRKPVGT